MKSNKLHLNKLYRRSITRINRHFFDLANCDMDLDNRTTSTIDIDGWAGTGFIWKQIERSNEI